MPNSGSNTNAISPELTRAIFGGPTVVEIQDLLDARYDKDTFWEMAVSSGILPESWLDTGPEVRAYSSLHQPGGKPLPGWKCRRPITRWQAVEMILAQEEVLAYEAALRQVLSFYRCERPPTIVWNTLDVSRVNQRYARFYRGTSWLDLFKDETFHPKALPATLRRLNP